MFPPGRQNAGPQSGNSRARPQPRRLARESTGYLAGMGFLLWLLAVILVIGGIITLFKGSIILGIVLIIVGFAVGPGGWSVIKRR